jgi:hypothetical protein
MKDRVTISREIYEKLTSFQAEKKDYYYERYHEYLGKYCDVNTECMVLQRENGYLRALCDKEADTDVIKYNGHLYRIVSTMHSKDVDGEDTLDFSAKLIRLSEVNFK